MPPPTLPQPPSYSSPAISDTWLSFYDCVYIANILWKKKNSLMAAGHTTLWLQKQSKAGPDLWVLPSAPQGISVLRDSGASDSHPDVPSFVSLASVRRGWGFKSPGEGISKSEPQSQRPRLCLYQQRAFSSTRINVKPSQGYQALRASPGVSCHHCH